jgi:Kef-type K+ transport system membrane component KefB
MTAAFMGFVLVALVGPPQEVHLHQVHMGHRRANVLSWGLPSDSSGTGFRVLRQEFGQERWETLGTLTEMHQRYVDEVGQGVRYRYRVVALAGRSVAASEPTDYVPESRPVNVNFNILLAVALAVLLGTAGARVFKKLKIPQVVAYIVIGVVLGSTGLKIIDQATADGLAPLSLLALGIIGFMIGGELKLSMFRQHGKRAMVILLAEGLGAFVIVTLLVAVITRNVPLALLLGAIASATAPAATVDVLWEYRTLGVLTTMVLAIVALDDGLALLLYGFASAIARTMLDGGGFSLMTVARPLYEILGAGALGGAVALLFWQAHRRIREKELVLALALGSILLLVGAADALGVDMILSAMVFGSVFVNVSGRSGEDVFGIVRRFAPPIYVLFFVLVGARLRLGALSGIMWLAALAYVAGRTGGKFLGVWVGTKLTRAPEVLRRFLGLCLFSQAGVAIGLAVLSSEVFAAHPEISGAIVAIVTATTFIVQIIGPPSVRFAVSRAGEIGRNVTEEDLLATFRVGDVMKTDQPSIQVDTPLAGVLDTVSRSEAVYFPVVDAGGRFCGVISLEGLKATLNAPQMAPLLVAEDLMEIPSYTVRPDTPLQEARQIMKDRRREFLVVVDADDSGRLVGFLIERRIQRVLEEEIARRRGQAAVNA